MMMMMMIARHNEDNCVRVFQVQPNSVNVGSVLSFDGDNETNLHGGFL